MQHINVQDLISGNVHGLKTSGINKSKKTQKQSMYTND